MDPEDLDYVFTVQWDCAQDLMFLVRSDLHNPFLRILPLYIVP